MIRRAARLLLSTVSWTLASNAFTIPCTSHLENRILNRLCSFDVHLGSSPPRSISSGRPSADCVRLSVSVSEDHTTQYISSFVDGKKVRCRCRVVYDGTKFNGFQVQDRDHISTEGDSVSLSIAAATKAEKKRLHKKKIQRTIQGTIEEVLQKRFQRPVRVVGAGRTDAGVHARGQAVHFDLTYEEVAQVEEKSNAEGGPMGSLEHSMNRMLPSDVCVWNVQRAPRPRREVTSADLARAGLDPNATSTSEGGEIIHNGEVIGSLHPWNVMMKSTSKLYSYRFSTAIVLDPIDRYDRWQLDSGRCEENTRWEDKDRHGRKVFRSHLSKPQKIDRLRRILDRYQGTNDFASFTNALDRAVKLTGRPKNTVRTVYNITLVEEGDENFRIDIFLDGALYKMVRNLVGTAIDVWRGRLSEEEFDRLLPSADQKMDSTIDNSVRMTRRRNPCKPAPSCGLTLERVFFDGDEF